MKCRPIRLEIENECLADWDETAMRWTYYLFCWEVWTRHRRRVIRTVRGRTKLAVGRALDQLVRKHRVTLLKPARGGR